MINALNALGYDQFEWVRWSPEVYTKYKFIRVSVVSENEKRFSSVIQNLITRADSTVIKTAYVYDYKPRQHIFYRNQWWEITAAAEITQDVAPQVMALTASGNKQFIIEMIRVNGYDAK